MNLTDGIIYSNLFPSSGGGAGAVDSVNGMTGAVTVTKGTVGLGNVDNTSDVNKPVSTATQTAIDLKQTTFVGICEETPIGANDISIDYTTRVLTITPPLGHFHFFTDGNGVVTKHTKTGAVNFPAFTDTTGIWYFHFDNTGNPISTQTAWTDFSIIATVYRLYWNNSLSGSSKSVIEALETHPNNISVADHEWKHKDGTKWIRGFDAIHNRLTSGAPNADGRNTVFAMTSGTNMDDNLKYIVTNGTGSAKFEQDMGNTTAGSLNATNSGLFKIRSNNASGVLELITATRFPFAYDGATNIPQYLTTLGVRTPVSNNYYFVYYVYSLQEPRTGEAVKLVSEYQEFSTLANAQASTWENLQTVYPTLTDNEIRPLYKLIFEYKTSYDVGCKYSVLRQVDDIRKARVTSTTTAAGSILATSVVFSPAEKITSTNAQSALIEVDRRTIPQYADLTAIKAVNTTSLSSGSLCQVVTLGQYVFQSASTATGDDVNVIVPTTGGGRWLKQSITQVATTRTAAMSWSGSDNQTLIDGYKPALVKNSLTGKNVVCLGSSVMMGYGLTTPATDNYCYQVIAETGSDYNYIDRGQSGSTSQQGYDRIINDVLSANPELVWIGFSPNNNGAYNQTTALNLDLAIVPFEKYLFKIIATLELKKIPYVVSGMYPRTGTSAQAYIAFKNLNTMLAEKLGAKYINFYGLLDNGAGLFKTGTVQADNIHPNSTGVTLMKRSVVLNLFDYLARNTNVKPTFNKKNGIKLGSDTTTAMPLRNYPIDASIRNQGTVAIDVKNPKLDSIFLSMEQSGNYAVSAGVDADGFVTLWKDNVLWYTTTSKLIPNKYNRIAMHVNPTDYIVQLYLNGELIQTTVAYTGFVHSLLSVGGVNGTPAKNSVGASFRNLCKWSTLLTDTDISKDASGVLLASCLENFHPLDYVTANTMSYENQGIAVGTTIVLRSTTWTLDTSSDDNKLAVLNTTGSVIASAATISPTSTIFHVSGVAEIATINLPYTGFVGDITIIPDGVFTFATSGNIAETHTAVVNRAIKLTYDGTKWYRIV